MPKPRLIVYSQEISKCSCFEAVFNTGFEAETAETSKQLLDKIRTFRPDTAVVCFCSAHERDADELLKLDALTGPLRVLTCSRELTLDFVSAAARQGADCFLCCDWDRTRIETIVLEAIRRGQISVFLETLHPGGLSCSPHIGKMLEEITRAFPQRLGENELAQRLGLSVSWLQKLCRRAFNSNLVGLFRRIRVYQALRMMKYTRLDNTEIALQLNYTEETSMARDFRKVLRLNPKEARNRLTTHSPENLFH
jgi:AraC-like DNA-binding protein